MSEYESGTFRCKVCEKEYLTKEEGDMHFRAQHMAKNKIVIEMPRKPGTKHKTDSKNEVKKTRYATKPRRQSPH
jgi:hypothetical protein